MQRRAHTQAERTGAAGHLVQNLIDVLLTPGEEAFFGRRLRAYRPCRCRRRFVPHCAARSPSRWALERSLRPSPASTNREQRIFCDSMFQRTNFNFFFCRVKSRRHALAPGHVLKARAAAGVTARRRGFGAAHPASLGSGAPRCLLCFPAGARLALVPRFFDRLANNRSRTRCAVGAGGVWC